MKTKLAPSLERSAIYRLCLQGRVSIDWSDWMTDSMVAFEDDRTVVTGEVRDQAALFGLLSFVRDLGVPLVSVEFLPTRKENVMYKNIVSIALKGIALAMGVAVIVLNILGSLTVENAINLMSFGLTSLALAAFQKE